MTPGWPTVRTLLLFFGGLAGLAHQTLIADTAQPILVAAFLAMMGLTIPLSLDERQKK